MSSTTAANRPATIVALQLSRPIRSAKFHVLGANDPQPAKIGGTTARPEVILPYFGVYVDVELEHADA